MAAQSVHDDPRIWGPRLARILETQRDLCRELELLGRRQGDLVAASDTDGLLTLLGQRQLLVDQVARLSDDLEPLKAVWEAHSGLLGPDQREKIGDLVREIGELIDKIGARDQADHASLEARRTEVARELSDIGRGRGALAAYSSAQGGAGGTGGGGAEYQDRSA